MKALAESEAINAQMNKLEDVDIVDEMEDIEIEEVKLVTEAELDLAFSTLQTLQLRNLHLDADAYSFLMDACGRSGGTHHANHLMEIMRFDGVHVDSEMYSSYLSAFTVANEIYPGTLVASPMGKQPTLGKQSNEKRRHTQDIGPGALVSSRRNMRSARGLFRQKSSSISVDGDRTRIMGRSSRDLRSSSPRLFSPRRRKQDLETTVQVSKHIDIGNSLLDFMYSNLKINTESNVCTQCSTVLSEDQVMEGWELCSFSNLTTECPQCGHRFISYFSVSSSKPDFEGSSGSGTPLHCEFLSPW